MIKAKATYQKTYLLDAREYSQVQLNNKRKSKKGFGNNG